MSENYKKDEKTGADNVINEAYSIGGMAYGVTPLDMAEAYASFANGGYHIETHAVTKIEYRSTGETVDFSEEKKKVMSVNKVILIGNVGKDPEVRYLDSGVAVATFPLATSDRAYTLANGTQVPERTEWHNIVLWRGLAETAEKYVHKGDKLYLEGKIRTRSYDDQAGVKRYVTEIFVDSMEMLSPKAAGVAPQATVQPNVQQQSIQSQVAPAQDNGADDLPF